MEMDSSLSNNENLATHQHPAPEQEITEVAEHVDGNQGNNKQKRKKSKVWEEMTEEIRDGKKRAICKHCGKGFDGSSKNGTTHLKNHLERCRRKRNGGEDLDKSMKTSDVIEEKSLIDLIKNCLDEEGFPTEHWDPSVLNSRKVDILQIYEEEKEKLGRFFSQLSGRLSLRIDDVYDCYLLTAHYIDENWQPNCKMIGFLEYDLGDYDYGYAAQGVVATLKKLCLDLKIDGNICSVFYDYDEIRNDDVGGEINSSTGEINSFTGEINSWFTQQGVLPFGGLLVRMDQFIHDSSWLYLRDIQRCVNHVNETPSNREKFQIALDSVKSVGKTVTSDPFPTNCVVYARAEIALGYKEAFCWLEQVDPDFKTINLTKKKWDEATAVWELWNSVHNVCRLFKTNSATPNMFFSKFCDLYVKLHLVQNTSPPDEEKFASEIQDFVDKYWSKYNLVLVITVILDPRFKMDIVQLWYNKIYVCDADPYLDKIDQDFKRVYNEYARGTGTSSISYLDAMGRPRTSSHNLISPQEELDRYLNEPKFPSVEKFDILAWWRLYSPIFPTLARMARDFLAIPICYSISKACFERIVSIIDDLDVLDAELQSALIYLLGL